MNNNDNNKRNTQEKKNKVSVYHFSCDGELPEKPEVITHFGLVGFLSRYLLTNSRYSLWFQHLIFKTK